MRPDIHAAIARHQRIAFQFSGGRDSTAALYLLRPYWDRMTVYHVNTGDQFPELAAVVARVERDVPVVRIAGNSPAWREAHGMPSDLVPADNTPFGRMLAGNAIRIAARFDCCAANRLAPMHRRMLADDITLIVRGTRADEFMGEAPMSGHRDERHELLYPIQHWSGQDVDDFIARHALPVAPFYAEGLAEAPECLGCTAWWGDGRADYMRRHHAQAWRAVRMHLKTIRAEAQRQLATLDDEE